MDNNQKKIINAANRVFKQLLSGHSEKIYHKALTYELFCLKYNIDTEKNIVVKYKDSNGYTHNLENERIDIFIHEFNIILELKAIQKQIQQQLEQHVNDLAFSRTKEESD